MNIYPDISNKVLLYGAKMLLKDRFISIYIDIYIAHDFILRFEKESWTFELFKKPIERPELIYISVST